jgi:hypothetical protein
MILKGKMRGLEGLRGRFGQLPIPTKMHLKQTLLKEALVKVATPPALAQQSIWPYQYERRYEIKNEGRTL